MSPSMKGTGRAWPPKSGHSSPRAHPRWSPESTQGSCVAATREVNHLRAPQSPLNLCRKKPFKACLDIGDRSFSRFAHTTKRSSQAVYNARFVFLLSLLSPRKGRMKPWAMYAHAFNNSWPNALTSVALGLRWEFDKRCDG